MSKRKASASNATGGKRVDAKASCVIAIDFGTAGTGYAYSFTGDDKIESKEPGGQEARKTLTNLLLKSDTGEFQSFGFQARRDYYECESNSRGAFFTNYKMELKDAGEKTECILVQALDGSQWRLLDVVTKTLRYVKEEALKETGRSLPHGLDAKDVQWVVTVPAIWGDFAKGFMRRAAFKAGLVEQEASERLLLALEPEAACVASDMSELAKPGDDIMVLDTGGGTVDITMNRLKSISPLRLDEIAAPSGGAWGSTFVDGHFESFVADLIGAVNFRAYKKTPFWIDLLEAWESVKTSFSSGDGPRSINMASLLEVLDDMKLNDLVSTYNSKHGTELKMRGKSTVVFPAENIRGLFQPVLDSITGHVRTLLASHPVKFIFLVGGFAESQLLQESVKSHFQSAQCRVIVPVRPGTAVLRGAVLFGKNQDVFASRIARFSYGFRKALQYDSSNPLHVQKGFTNVLQKKKFVRYVHDVFERQVQVGEKLPAGHSCYAGGRRTLSDHQYYIKFQIYQTPLGHVDFTTHSSCRRLGSVDIPATLKQSVGLDLAFGATEIKATAVNETTGERNVAIVQYSF